MSLPEFRGARGSNAGDDFHELWALSQALTLLDRETDLIAIAVEGLRPEDEKGSPAEAFDAVDCAMFYNGSSVAAAERIEIIQFKYSAANPDGPWTVARLTSSSAKTRDNSVIRRLADTFNELRTKRNDSPAGIRLQLISNQPADPDVVQLFQDVVSGQNLSDQAKTAEDKLRKSSGLKDDTFREFAAAIDLSQTGSRFLIRENVLRTISTWTEGDARALTDSLLRFMRQKMMPESKGEWIRRETILAELGFSDVRALFPCPPELAAVRHVIRRKMSSELVGEMISGRKHVCVHGHAGCGKTTALREIESQLPAGSLMLVFDCYGAGRYLDSDAYRHRPKDAFLQLSNDLASKLRVPLLLTRNDGVDYPRVFHDRLEKAAQTVSGLGQAAVLIIAVDAADNSVTAAQKLVPQERSFVSDFVNLGDIPDNVRLLITARTGRLDQLALPDRFKCFEIAGFNRDETAEHVRSTWPDAPDTWIEEFHELSQQNPRVQQYALRWAGEKQGRARDFLLPSGKGLTDVFRHQFHEAQKKAGTNETLEKFSAAISALPHPVPFLDLSVTSGLTEPELADICADLAPGIRTTDRSVGFGDEDFETFIRDEGRQRLGAMQLVVADRFMMNRGTDPYAATHLVAALYAVGRRQDIIHIVENEAEPTAIVDPILRREIRLQRLRIAMQACTDMGDGASMLRTLLIGAEAMRGSEAILNLVLKFPDLATAFMQDGAVRLVLRDPNLFEYHGPLLFHLFRERASALNRIAARGEYQQLGAWLERRRRELDNVSRDRRPRGGRDWEIGAIDLAAEVEGVLFLGGPQAAIDTLRRWRPRRMNLEVARIVIHRLIVSGKADIVEACVAQGLVKSPWNLVLLVPLALAGRDVDLGAVEKALDQIGRRGWIRLRKLTGSNDDGVYAFWLDTILTACEIFIAKGGDHGRVLGLLKAFADESFRQIDQLHTFYASLIDLQLRAQALLVRLEDRALTLEEFLIEPPKLKEGNDQGREPSSSRREEIRRFVRPLLALYDARANLVARTASVLDPIALLDSAISSLEYDDYYLRRIHGAFEIRKRAAIGVASLRFLASTNSTTLLKQCLKVFGRSLDPFGSSELAVLWIFALNAESHGEALAILANRAREIVSQRTVASEKVDALLQLSRFVAQISHDEASAIFKLAHETTEEMDTEARHQLRAVAAMAIRSSGALESATRRDAAQALYSISTDAAIRLSDHEGFPWADIIEALVALDLPMSLACVARWQDADQIHLNSSLSALIRHALSQKVISPTVGVALLDLINTKNATLLETVCKDLTGLSVGRQQTLIDELAKDVLLASGPGDDIAVTGMLKRALPDGGSVGPWLHRLEETTIFLEQASHSGTSKSRMDNAGVIDHITSPTTDLSGHADFFKSPEHLAQALENEMASARAAWQPDSGAGSSHFVSTEDTLEQMRKAVPASNRVTYLTSLAAVHSERIADSSIAQAIYRAVEAWKASLSVRMWCREHLPNAIVERLPGFCRELTYGARSSLTPLLDLLAAEQVDVPRVLTLGIGRHVEDLSAVAIYELTRLIAERMGPFDAASALDDYLKRLVRRIPTAHMDRMNTADIPNDVESAIARFLFALMSDCDVRIRWRAAHSLRRLAHAGDAKILTAMLVVYDRQTEESFRAANEPFYWMAARLWWTMAVCRVAHEIPHALSAYGSKLLEIATDETFPHVLIRSFAKDAALTLADGGDLELTSAQRKVLSKANTGRLARKKGQRIYARVTPREEGAGKERRFQFDPLDTVPYWYQPALAMFADVTQDEFLDAAENWIVNKWNVAADTSRWERETRKYRFTERNWRASSNDHGSEPTLERFSTYLERHAMFCAIGGLIQSRKLIQSDDAHDDTLETWLKRRSLEFPPLWLADFRGPVPLEARFWHAPKSPIGIWIDGASEADFIDELCITGSHKNMIVVDAWHEIGSSQFSSEARVASALVAPTTGAALMRALQSANDPYDYKLPDEGEEQFEINVPPYRLRGWLRNSSAWHTGIDQKDPLRMSIRGVTSAPGEVSARHLAERSTPEGWPMWCHEDGSIGFEHEGWSTKPDDQHSDRRLRGLESEGRRLWVSVTELQKHLLDTKMDLIVSIKLMREEGDRGYSEDYDKKKRSHKGKVILLRANGDIEDSGGRIGTWQTHSSRAGA